MKVKIIAEIGSVHDGSQGNAKELIKAAANAGATAVKFQTHIAAAETTMDAPNPSYFHGETRFNYFERTSFSLSQWRELKKTAQDCGVEFLSSPFSIEAVSLLESVGVDAYKIASGEVTNTPLLTIIAKTGKPVLLSSGMSNWTELENALRYLSGSGPVTALQCTSEYPCPPNRVGINIMTEMADRWQIPIGLSDHTMGPTAAIAAVLAGAVVIEKHFTFSRLMYGSDAQHSMEPSEFKQMVKYIREAEAIRSSVLDKDDLTNLETMKRTFQKSIVMNSSKKKGETITESDLSYKKPGTGIAPQHAKKIIGKIVLRDLSKDHLITWDDIQ